jgi:hypothetical protein
LRCTFLQDLYPDVHGETLISSKKVLVMFTPVKAAMSDPIDHFQVNAWMPATISKTQTLAGGKVVLFDYLKSMIKD